jgi:hypothetical protein
MIIRRPVMVKVIDTPETKALSGKMGNIVFYVRNGKAYFRKAGKQTDPKTPAQCAMRSAFKEAVAAWGEFDESEKKKWNTRGRKENMSGYHLFMKEKMKKSPQPPAAPLC